MLLMAPLLINISDNAGGVVQVEAQSVDSSFRDYTLISGTGAIYAVDADKNTVWSVPFYGQDKEMLPNGNLLVTSGRMNTTSSIKEVNITTSSVVWEIFQLDGQQLNFTHDTDWLGVDQSGQDIFLTADTYNDRVVEFYRNGTVIWTWYAIDHFSYGTPGSDDWTHLNDVDRLADGTTMISLRNFNKVIIVNTTATGEILWEYGDYYNDNILNGPHNPEVTPTGTLLIADSENHRIIEVNMTTKEIIWEYAPTGDNYLGWPRDADVLPNGNILVSDTYMNRTGKNRVYEIDPATKEIVWYHDAGANNYDCDRLDTVLPTVTIESPAAVVYDGTAGVPISLSCADPWYDEIFYRIYDETDGQWLTDNNVTYNTETNVFLENNHTYTLYAWAKDLVMEGGASPTSRAIVQLEEDSVQFKTNLDTTAPEISNITVEERAGIVFTATVTDNESGVKQVTLHYETVGWNNPVPMMPFEENSWSAIIPLFEGNRTIFYTITAEDNAGNIVTTEETIYRYVIPEFSVLGFLSIFITATLAALLYRRQRNHKNLSLFRKD